MSAQGVLWVGTRGGGLNRLQGGRFTQYTSSQGLTISRRFCQMMGGDIAVESRPREGSTFTVRLPAAIAPSSGEEVRGIETKRAVPGTAPNWRNEHEPVLVIDDD